MIDESDSDRNAHDAGPTADPETVAPIDPADDLIARVQDVAKARGPVNAAVSDADVAFLLSLPIQRRADVLAALASCGVKARPLNARMEVVVNARRVEAEREREATRVRTVDPDAMEVGAHLLMRGTDELSDLGNAETYRHHHGGFVRYVTFGSTSSGDWYSYVAGKWDHDPATAERRWHATSRALMECYGGDMDKAVIASARRSQSAAGLSGMFRCLQSMMSVPFKVFDADPYALNVANGTIDLRTGHLRPHRPEDMLSRMSPVHYDPAALCPRWDQFLAEIQPDKEVRDFLGRCVGYTAIGDIREHALLINHGTGRNGKNVFMDTLVGILGDYARIVPVQLLMTARNDSHPTASAGLRGARLASASETEEGRVLDVARVKQLTGGGAIVTRRMGEDFWEFQPTHTLWIDTQHKPIITETKDAIWKRVMLVKWPASFAGREDFGLKKKLAAEWPGILAWLVRQCAEYLRAGLAPPSAVTMATQQYRQEQDMLGDFLAEQCVLEPRAKIARSDLRRAYELHAKSIGTDRPLEPKTFAEKLRERGCEERKVRNLAGTSENGWRGIRLKTENEKRMETLRDEAEETQRDLAEQADIEREQAEERAAIEAAS